MMKLLLLSFLGIFLLGNIAFSQTTLYTEDFTSGSSWTLNTVLAAEGSNPNPWGISCQENGQTAGQCGSPCAGNNTLHVYSALGDLGASYFETGFFMTNTNRRAESGNINTVGATGLTLSFDMIGAGNAQDHTDLVYSTNGGSTWTTLAGTLTSLCCGGVACSGGQQGLWQTNTYALPASCEGISNLRIGFVWVNYDDGIATDPTFAVDNIEITGTMGGGSNSITTGTTLSPTSWCAGTAQTINVDFTSTGTFNAGNVYTAQLSNASGSFAAPTAIGTLTSTANSGVIVAVVPGATPAGTGYRIRVVSDNPATIGSDNGVNLVINALPNVSLQSLSAVCADAAPFALSGGSPSGGTYSGTGVSGGSFNPATAGAGTHNITYTYVDGNGCSGSAVQPITVNAAANVSFQPLSDVCVAASPFALSGGAPSGGTYSGTGVSGGTFDPAAAGLGTHTITYSYTTGSGCSGSQSQTITVTSGATVTQQPFSDVCEEGGIVTLVGGSPSGGTYSGSGVSGVYFDPSVTGLGTVNITYTYTDAFGCTGSDTEPLTVIASPTVTLDPYDIVCSTDPFFTLTGGTPSNGTYTGTGVTGGIFDPASAGIGTHTIVYTFTDGNGCSGTASQSITVDGCEGIEEHGYVSFTLQPNPTNDAFSVISQVSIESVELVDMSGRVIRKYDVSKTTFNVQGVPSGVYFVRVSSGGAISEQRLIVQ